MSDKGKFALVKVLINFVVGCKSYANMKLISLIFS